MFSTVVLVAIFAGAVVASAVLWAIFLSLGLHWAKVPDVTIWRLVAATSLVVLLNPTLTILFFVLARFFDPQPIVLRTVELAAAVIVPCAVIGAIFKIRILRAFLA